tara:strand:- start:1303 stop:2031 length:729 start_codon:yes stop_codon:yes gene_type:complete
MIKNFLYKRFENTEMILSFLEESNAKSIVLDYGCGAGDLVNMLQNRGYDAYGCDIGLRSKNTKIKLMNDKFEIPFENDRFDFIVSNQVVEHVHDIKIMIKEFKRVLKKDGQILLLFPTFETFIEWHLRMPIVHWFQRFHFVQKLLLYIFCWLRIGNSKNHSKKGKEYVNDRFNFLQRYTVYRTRHNLKNLFRSGNFAVKTIEQEFFYKKYFIHPVLKALFNKFTFPLILGSVYVLKKENNNE